MPLVILLGRDASPLKFVGAASFMMRRLAFADCFTPPMAFATPGARW